MDILQAFMLVVALSVDAFVAGFSYGTDRIRIPMKSVMVLNLICSMILAASLTLGSVAARWVIPGFTKKISFGILFFLSIVKLCDSMIKRLIKKHEKLHKKFKFSILSLRFILSIYATPQAADTDASHDLSMKEAASLAVALSLDGLAVGFGAGMSGINLFEVVALSFVIGVVAVVFGCRLGNILARKSGPDFSWLGGVLLMMLAFMRLV